MGKLFTEGRLWTQRIMALAGPPVTNPRLLRVQCGVDLNALLRDELKPGNNRIISGPVLSGRNAINEVAYLGRYHQVSVIEEASRGHMGRLTSRDKPYSLHHFLNRFRASRSCFDSTLHGPCRVMFPVGDFERVMPLDLLPTPLLKALLTTDIDNAKALGCLELDEEDLALCTYVCCSKQDYGLALRTCLAHIEKEPE